MIAHSHNCVFVHIPKTAGQSIEHVFLELAGLTWQTRDSLLLRPNSNPALGPPRLAHLRARDYTRYNYLTESQFTSCFKFSFVRNPWDRMVSLYKYFADQSTCGFKEFLFGEFLEKYWTQRYWFVGPQWEFVADEHGQFLVDYIGRFETLQGDFDRVCERLGIAMRTLPHVNRSGAGKASMETAKQYVAYYDDDAKDLVARLYKRDIELFDYKFMD
jgi:hypothetical protein